MIDLVVKNGPDDLRRVAAKLRRVGNAQAIRRQLMAGLKEGVKPAVTRTKASALALPAYGTKSTGLRRKMARVAGSQVRTGRDAGVRVRISRARMGDQAPMAKVTNEGRWRHPVYGETGAWVTQTSRRGWFDDANRYSGPPVRRALGRVITDIERQLK